MLILRNLQERIESSSKLIKEGDQNQPLNKSISRKLYDEKLAGSDEFGLGLL